MGLLLFCKLVKRGDFILLTNTVETKWNNCNKDWFISKGYNYTGYRDSLIVKTEDLQPKSAIKIKALCDDCNDEFNMAYSDYLENVEKNCGHFYCMRCYAKHRLKKEKSLNNTDPDIAKNLLHKEDGDYNTINSKYKLPVVCEFCGNTYYNYPRKIKDSKSNLCPYCGDGFSFNNKFIYNVLKQIGINFNREFHDKKWCYIIFKNKKCKVIYDFEFCINNNKYIIEADGGFHYHETDLTNLEDIKKIDELKDNLAVLNGYKIIRINCDQDNDYIHMDNFIKEQLLFYFKNILDFSNVDWDFCSKNAQSPLRKKVWELFNKNYRQIDIQKELNVSSSFVKNSLKIGDKLGVINYKSQLETSKEIKNKIKEIWSNGNFDLYDISLQVGLNNTVSVRNKLNQIYEETGNELFKIELEKYCYCYEDNCFYSIEYLSNKMNKEHSKIYRCIWKASKSNKKYFDKSYSLCSKQEAYLNSMKHSIKIYDER